MADRYWIAGSAANWNDTANWSTSSGGAGGASVPGSSDHARFDSNGNGNCRLNASIDVLQISGSTYTGTIDAASDDLNHTIGTGGLSFSGSSTLSLGDGDWTINGNCFIENTLTAGLSQVTLAGSSKSFGIGPNRRFYDLVVSGSYTGNNSYGNNWGVSHSLVVSGSITNESNNNCRIDSGASVSVSGSWLVSSGTGGISMATGATITNDGTINVPVSIECDGSTPYTPIKTGTGAYGGTISLMGGGNGARTVRMEGGTHTFKHLTLSNFYGTGTHTLDLDTNDPNLTITGDVTVASRWTWTKGSGTITLSGTANQSIDFSSETIEDLVVNKSAGTVTVTTSGFTTDSFTGTAGTFAIGTLTVTVSGGLTAAAGFTATASAGGTFVVGGNFALSGSSGNNVVWNGPDVDITGTATADYTTATNSDASAGTTVTASNSTDGGGNTNWSFATAGQPSMRRWGMSRGFRPVEIGRQGVQVI